MPPSGSTNFLHSACVVGHVLHPTRGMQISDIIKMSFIIYPSSIDPTSVLHGLISVIQVSLFLADKSYGFVPYQCQLWCECSPVRGWVQGYCGSREELRSTRLHNAGVGFGGSSIGLVLKAVIHTMRTPTGHGNVLLSLPGALPCPIGMRGRPG
jgi:hypothetical protein